MQVVFSVLARAFTERFFELSYKVAGIIESDLCHHLFDGKEGGLEQLTGAVQPHRLQKPLGRNARVATKEVSQVGVRQIDATRHVTKANAFFAVLEKIGS